MYGGSHGILLGRSLPPRQLGVIACMAPNQGSVDLYQQSLRIGKKTRAFKGAIKSLETLETWDLEVLMNSSGSCQDSDVSIKSHRREPSHYSEITVE